MSVFRVGVKVTYINNTDNTDKRFPIFNDEGTITQKGLDIDSWIVEFTRTPDQDGRTLGEWNVRESDLEIETADIFGKE